MPPRLVVCAVIERSGRFLIAQRSRAKHYPLQWEFPGGKIEPSEAPEAALAREVAEELGCAVEVLGLLERFVHDYGGEHHYDLAFYHCRILRGEPAVQPGQGIERVVWAEPASLPGYEFLEGNRPMVARLAQSGTPRF